MSARQPPSPSKKSFPPPSSSQTSQSHAPLQPSGLREAHTLVTSPDEISYSGPSSQSRKPSSAHPSPNTRPTQADGDEPNEDEPLLSRLHLGELPSKVATETSALLKKPFEIIKPHAHEGPCDHGTFSPRLQSRPQSVRSVGSGYGFGGAPPLRSGRVDSGDAASDRDRGVFGGVLEGIGLRRNTQDSPRGSTRSHKKKMSTTSYLAELHGITNTTTM